MRQRLPSRRCLYHHGDSSSDIITPNTLHDNPPLLCLCKVKISSVQESRGTKVPLSPNESGIYGHLLQVVLMAANAEENFKDGVTIERDAVFPTLSTVLLRDEDAELTLLH